MSDGELVVRFVAERTTKNTVRYQEVEGDPPAIGTLYVQKWALKHIADGNYPTQLLVTLESVGEPTAELPGGSR